MSSSSYNNSNGRIRQIRYCNNGSRQTRGGGAATAATSFIRMRSSTLMIFYTTIVSVLLMMFHNTNELSVVMAATTTTGTLAFQFSSSSKSSLSSIQDNNYKQSSYFHAAIPNKRSSSNNNIKRRTPTIVAVRAGVKEEVSTVTVVVPPKEKKSAPVSSVSAMTTTPPTTMALSTTTTIALMIMIFSVLLLPLPSNAIDHPAIDNVSLGIPIPIPDIRYFISGGLCAAASHGVTTPIDVIKTRIQADPENLGGGLSITDAAIKILNQDGPQVLLGGLLPTVVGYGVEGAVKFGLYESLKPTFASIFNAIVSGTSDNPALPYLFASVVAGAAASVLLCPLERIRIQTVTQSKEEKKEIIAKEEDTNTNIPSDLFNGISAMLSKQVPYTICKQVSFDVFAAFLYGLALSSYNLSSTDVKAEVSVVAAFMASIIACIASHPGDVILTETYRTASGVNGAAVVEASSSSSKFTDVVTRVYEQGGGINAFFTGLTARFFHVGAIITSQLVLYDIIKQMLGLPATGT